MTKPINRLKTRAWPGATVVERGKGHIKHQHPTDPTRFMLDTVVGDRSLHFGTGPFTEANEIDTGWIDADPILDAPWQKKMVLADYNAYAFREATLGFDQGQLIEYRHPASGESVSFEPQQLQWTNDLDQIEPVEDPQAIAATIDDDMLTWVGAYGSGIDFRWQTQATQLMKFIDIDSLASLGAPPQFIIDGGNPVLKVGLIFQKTAGIEIWVDGVEWDEKSNNPQTTLSNVEFRLATTGEQIWHFKAPKAWDQNADTEPVMRLRKSAITLFVEILTPWSWLETASYPVIVDASVEVDIATGLHDAYQDVGGGANRTSVGHQVGTGSTGSGTPNLAIGFRFAVAIDQGVTVNTGTYIELYKDDTAWITVQCTWYADDVDDAAAIANNEDMTDGGDRTATTATVSCNENINRLLNTYHKYPAGGEWQSIIAELVARAGWSSGQYMMLIAEGDGASAYTSTNCVSYNEDATNPPTLHIEYTAGGGASIAVPLGTLVITGKVPTVATPVNVNIPLATLVITGKVPTASSSTVVDIPVGTLVITGKVPDIEWSGSADIPLATLVITGLVPIPGWSGSANIPLATLVITSYVPTVATPVDVPVPLATLVITGLVPTADIQSDVTVPVGTLVITGHVPTVVGIAGANITVPLGTLVITGLVPIVGWSGGMTVPVGTLVITGHVPTVVGVAGTDISVPVGTLVITGLVPVPGWSGSADIPLATLVITAYIPLVGWSGDTAVPLATLFITGLVPTAVATANAFVDVPVAGLTITGLVPTIAAGAGADVIIPLALLVITGYAPIPSVPIPTVAGGKITPTIMVGPPPVDRSFPVEKFYAALDNEAQKMRVPVNQAYKDAEEEAEELKRRARYARDEALDAIYNDLRQVNLRLKELDQAKTDIRSMQMRRRLEDARNRIDVPEPKPKKKKDRRPKLTLLKKKQYKKDRRK